MKRRVAAAAGGGMSHEEIALGLGISRNTLEKHFEHELSVGAYEKRLEVLEAMQRTAKKGNVAAQKAYMNLTPHVAAPPQPTEGLKPSSEAPTRPVKAEPIGKKEQAEIDARTAATDTPWQELLHKQAPPGTQTH